MARTKYEKFILRAARENQPQSRETGVTSVDLQGSEDWCGIQHRMRWALISQPTTIVDEPHTHDCDEFLCFLSSDPAHELDFGAEVEVSLGQEREKQVIKSPTVVCIPEGLVHGPVQFKTISKPVLFCHIYMAPKYARKAAKEK